MPALQNIRHEAFAQRLVDATKTKMTNGEAYTAAGYKAADDVAEAAASRLLGDVRNGIQKRVNEIMEAGARRASVTVESLLGELDRVLAGALGAEQFGAARGVIDSKARLKGLFVDRLEIVDTFSACQSADDVVSKLLQEMPSDDVLSVLDALRDSVLSHAANSAKAIQRPSQGFVSGAETAAAMAIFHPPKSRQR